MCAAETQSVVSSAKVGERTMDEIDLSRQLLVECSEGCAAVFTHEEPTRVGAEEHGLVDRRPRRRADSSDATSARDALPLPGRTAVSCPMKRAAVVADEHGVTQVRHERDRGDRYVEACDGIPVLTTVNRAEQSTFRTGRVEDVVRVG